MKDLTDKESGMILILALLLFMLAGCATVPAGAPFDWRDVDGHDPDYNAAGGYVGACGDLPGILGDDC